ncbi:MAG: hypothetical protein ACXWC9_10210 [Pseudobdellovibrionaceae bacterium]
MKEFNAKLTESADEVVLEVSGAIDAAGRFPSIRTQKNLVIKFNNITLMNSYGIKVWCKWAAEHKDLPTIFLDECPFVFAKNFASIRGFLNPNMKVRSFYVPFYSDESHETKNVLMTLDKDYTSDGFYNIPKAVDSKGSPMEIDIDKRSYFQFLKKD